MFPLVLILEVSLCEIQQWPHPADKEIEIQRG